MWRTRGTRTPACHTSSAAGTAASAKWLRFGSASATRSAAAAAQAAGGGLRLRLSFDRGGLCGEETALRALGERLERLDRAPGAPPPRLQCRSNADDTEFTLELPA